MRNLSHTTTTPTTEAKARLILNLCFRTLSPISFRWIKANNYRYHYYFWCFALKDHFIHTVTIISCQTFVWMREKHNSSTFQNRKWPQRMSCDYGLRFGESQCMSFILILFLCICLPFFGTDNSKRCHVVELNNQSNIASMLNALSNFVNFI